MPEKHRRNERIDFIERRYLPRCAHMSAASAVSPMRWPTAMPSTGHWYSIICFPWSSETPSTDRCATGREQRFPCTGFRRPSGLDRGLQDAIRAAGLLNEPVQLHIRGTVHDDVRRALVSLAEESGIADRLYFHPQVPPNELLARTAEHDVGLALEQGHTPNRSICVTNKAFYYPLAGLAVAATDVPGQRRVLDGHFDFSGLYMPGDAVGLARILERWTDRSALEAAQTKGPKDGPGRMELGARV